jgi:hypothetical protein
MAEYNSGPKYRANLAVLVSALALTLTSVQIIRSVVFLPRPYSRAERFYSQTLRKSLVRNWRRSRAQKPINRTSHYKASCAQRDTPCHSVKNGRNVMTAAIFGRIIPVNR